MSLRQWLKDAASQVSSGFAQFIETADISFIQNDLSYLRRGLLVVRDSNADVIGYELVVDSEDLAVRIEKLEAALRERGADPNAFDTLTNGGLTGGLDAYD